MSEKVINFEILHQGAPIVDEAYIYRDGKDAVAIVVELKSKNCEIFTDGSSNNRPVISLQATKFSDGLTDGQGLLDLTEVVFSDYPGWSVWSSELDRSTVRVCLVRDMGT